MATNDLIITLYNNVCCVGTALIFLALGIGVVSSRPKQKKKQWQWVEK